eukprot:TRINITY_DN1089_c0_g1_i1.p1 TRINITY_DN1089_c0_g1~~TRINITY_DN1089_c0_g1_i1.p1  ORF type:complete len:1745 (+),score=471.80 TRINITY_DN1089_c0_g1_i1:76-5310(+)
MQQGEEDKKCVLCGFNKELVEVCPKTFKPHQSVDEPPKNPSSDDDKCELCGFKKSVVDVCPKTFKPHTTATAASEPSEPASAPVTSDDDLCNLCGLRKSIVEVCPKTFQPHAASTVADTKDDDKCDLCGFKKTVVEVCPKTFKPHLQKADSSSPPQETLQQEQTDVPTDDDKCDLCGFKKSVIEVCPKTFKPHLKKTPVSDNPSPPQEPTDVPADNNDGDDKCDLCGFRKSVVEVCPKTFKPHAPEEGPATTKSNKCELCGLDESVVKVCPKTFKPHQQQPVAVSDQTCELCGLDQVTVAVCPKTFKPHNQARPKEEEEEEEEDDEEEPTCDKCGFSISLTDICPETNLPHTNIHPPAPIAPDNDGGDDDDEEEEEDEPTCPKCGFSISMTDICPETNLPHDKGIPATRQPAHDKKEDGDDDEEEEEVVEPSCDKCGFSLSMTEICPETNLPHEKAESKTEVPEPIKQQVKESVTETADPTPTTNGKCDLCGFTVTVVETCPKTLKPHVLPKQPPAEDGKCGLCGFTLAVVEICPKTLKPHIRPPADEDEPTPTTDGKCDLCGFTVTVVETCPKTLKPHVLPKQPPAEDGKCGLCGFTLAVVEICPKTLKPHIRPPADEDEPTPTTDGKCDLCGFTVTVVETCPKTLKPHVLPKQQPVEDGKCGLCGFTLAVVEVCPKTLKPHIQPSADEDEPTPTTDGKCDLCGFTVTVVETCPKTLKPHVLPKQPPAEDGKCGLCGFTLAVVEICPKTLKPHIQPPADEDEPTPTTDGKCDLCGFTVTVVETCPKTLKPHVLPKQQPVEDGKCGLCGFTLAVVEVCPKTLKPHIQPPSEDRPPTPVSEELPVIEVMCQVCGSSKTKVDVCPVTGIPHNKEPVSRASSESSDGPVCGKCEYLIKEKDTCPITNERHSLKESDLDLTISVVPPSPADTSFGNSPRVQSVIMRVDTNPWDKIRSQLTTVGNKPRSASWKQGSPVPTAAWKQRLKKQIRSREPTPGLWTHSSRPPSDGDSQGSPVSMQLSADTSVFGDISDGAENIQHDSPSFSESVIEEKVSMTEEELADELIAIENTGYMNKVHNPVPDTPPDPVTPEQQQQHVDKDDSNQASDNESEDHPPPEPTSNTLQEDVNDTNLEADTEIGNNLTAPKSISDTAMNRYTELVDQANALRTVGRHIIPTLTSELGYLAGGMEASNRKIEEVILKHKGDPTRNPSLVRSSTIAWLLDEEGADTPPEIPLPAFDSIFVPKRVEKERSASVSPEPVPPPSKVPVVVETESELNTPAPLSWEEAQRILFNQVLANREGSFEQEEKALEEQALANARKSEERDRRLRERQQRIQESAVELHSINETSTSPDTEYSYSGDVDIARYSPSSTCSSTVKTPTASTSSDSDENKPTQTTINPAFNYLYTASGASPTGSKGSRSQSPYQCVSVERRRMYDDIPTTQMVQKPDVIQMMDVHSTWVSKSLMKETVATQTDKKNEQQLETISMSPKTTLPLSVAKESNFDHLPMTPIERYSSPSNKQSKQVSSPIADVSSSSEVDEGVSCVSEVATPVKGPSSSLDVISIKESPVLPIDDKETIKESNETIPDISVIDVSDVVKQPDSKPLEVVAEQTEPQTNETPSPDEKCSLCGFKVSMVEVCPKTLKPHVTTTAKESENTVDTTPEEGCQEQDADETKPDPTTTEVVDTTTASDDGIRTEVGNKCDLCGFSTSTVEVCPKTLKPHNANKVDAEPQTDETPPPGLITSSLQ